MTGKILNSVAIPQILLHTDHVAGSVLDPGKRKGGKINRNPCLFQGSRSVMGLLTGSLEKNNIGQEETR